MSTTTQNRVFVALKLPRLVPRLIKVAQAIIAAQTNNPHIPNPSPPLATLTTALDVPVTTETATKTRAAGTMAARNLMLQPPCLAAAGLQGQRAAAGRPTALLVK